MLLQPWAPPHCCQALTGTGADASLPAVHNCLGCYAAAAAQGQHAGAEMLTAHLGWACTGSTTHLGEYRQSQRGRMSAQRQQQQRRANSSSSGWIAAAAR